MPSTSPSSKGSTSRLLVPTVLLVALGLRLLAQLELRGSLVQELLLGDAKIFDAWARRLSSGDWLGQDVFYQAPLYPYFLGALYKLFGADALFARTVQALLGAFGCALVASSTRSLHSRAAGWIAGLACAAYGPAIAFDGMIQKASLAFFLSAALLRTAVAFAERPRGIPAVGCGLVLGLLVLTRENAAVLVPVLLIWLGFSIREAPRALRMKWVVAAVLGLGLPLGAVAWRNERVGGTPLPTASNVGVNFYLGNGANADGLYMPLIPGRGHPEYEAADAKRLAEEALGRELGPHDVSRYWIDRTIGEIGADPVPWTRLLGRKSFLVVNRAEIMDAEAIEVHRDSSVVLELSSLLFHFGILFPLAVAGLVARRRAPWGPAFANASGLLLLASLVLFFVNARFRIAAVPFLAPGAAAGLLEVIRAVRERHLRRSVTIAGVLVLALVVCNLDPGLPGDPRATTYSNACRELLAQGRTNEAVHWGSEAVRYDPADASARMNLAEALFALDRGEDAKQHFLEAGRLAPHYAADVHDALARLASDDPATALEHFAEALALAPDDVRVRYNRALLLRRSGQTKEAEIEYREVLRRAPDHVDAWNNLAWLLYQAGHDREAKETWERALAVDGDFILALRQLAWLLATSPDAELRDGNLALEHTRRLLELGLRREPNDLELLAAALAEAGRFEEAARTEEEALRLAELRGAEEPAEALRRLEIYRAGRPLRIAPPEPSPPSASTPASEDG